MMTSIYNISVYNKKSIDHAYYGMIDTLFVYHCVYRADRVCKASSDIMHVKCSLKWAGMAYVIL